MTGFAVVDRTSVQKMSSLKINKVGMTSYNQLACKTSHFHFRGILNRIVEMDQETIECCVNWLCDLWSRERSTTLTV